MAIDIVIIVIVLVIVIVARTKGTPAAIVDQARVEPAPATLLNQTHNEKKVARTPSKNPVAALVATKCKYCTGL